MMEQAHSAASSHQMRLAPTAHHMVQLGSTPASARVHDIQPFTQSGPRVRSRAGGNLQSYAFQFYNKDISEEQGHPQSHAKETFGQFYGGNIGAQ